MEKQFIYSLQLKPLILLVATAGLLSGCVSTMQQYGYSCTKTPLVQPCSVSPVLITNLSAKTSKQQLLLPNGQPCGETINEH